MASSTISARDDAPPPRELPPLLALVRDCWARPDGRVALLGAGGCLALLALVFRNTLAHFVHVWSIDPNYSHGFLVPPISLYFANLAAREGPIRQVPAVALGVALLAVALMGRLATIVVPVGFVGDLSFLTGLAGLCALFAGRAALRRFSSRRRPALAHSCPWTARMARSLSSALTAGVSGPMPAARTLRACSRVSCARRRSPRSM